MKKIIIIFLLNCAILSMGFSQTFTVSGPDKVEVGFEYNFTAKFDTTGNPNIEKGIWTNWTTADHGMGQSGLNGILGLMDNTPVESISHYMDELPFTDAISVVFGDFDNHNHVGDVYCSIQYSDDGHTRSVRDTQLVYIYRVFQPNFTAPSSIQACCTDQIEVQAKDYGDAQIFEWEILSGGTITSINNDKISVTPTNDGTPIEIWCTVSREANSDFYYRENNIVIPRHQPVTPDINGFSYICAGDEAEYCVDGICGMNGVNWIIPPEFEIVSGAGTNCIIVSPSLDIQGGTSFSIKAQAIMEGGCVATISSKLVTVFTYEDPPEPQGELYLDVPDDWDPCDRYKQVLPIGFTGTYNNGFVYITPVVWFSGPPFPNGEPQYTVVIEVCYYNVCSGLEKCKSFTFILPAPCFYDKEDDDFGNKMVYVSKNRFDRDKKRENINRKTLGLPENDYLNSNNTNFTRGYFYEENNALEIYPNPFTKSFVVNFPYIDQGEIKVLNVNGQIVLNRKICHSNEINIELNDDLSNGIYIFKFSSEKYSYVKRILKQD